MKGMTTCKVCGREFPLIIEEHYTARDPERKGVLPALTGQEESVMWDAFDCPHCGCQNIMQNRKPEVIFTSCEDVCEGESESEGCRGCAYTDKSEDEDPCIRCKHNYTDKYKKEESDE